MVDGFAIGDIVMLKSGGPRMTIDAIEDVSGTRKAICFWFSEALAQKATFALTSIESAQTATSDERKGVRVAA